MLDEYAFGMENIFERNHEHNDEGNDGEQSENEEERMEVDEVPLYHDAEITVKESMLLLSSLMLRHNLNMTCMSDIITVIQLHCPEMDLKTNSLYKFGKYFNIDVDNKFKKHFYCSNCMRELANVNDICPSCPQQKSSYFLQLPIERQLTEMYKRRDFYDQLRLRFEQQNQRDNSMRDVYDGTLYKTWINNGFLMNPHNISFTWYTDGGPVYKSSKVSVWFRFLTINEIPYEYRKKKENTILLGV